MKIQAYLYDGYWEDIGTIEAFYEANLALTDSPSPKFRCAPGQMAEGVVLLARKLRSLLLFIRPRALWDKGVRGTVGIFISLPARPAVSMTRMLPSTQ